jgi:Family of unknown function (DUF6868)
MELSQVTEFLGWCSVINISVLMLTTLMLTLLRGFIVPMHSKMLGLGEEDLLRVYVNYLSNFKIAVLILNLAPYLALKIMGS